MNGLPYYKAYPRDFIEGAVGMPFEEKCAYRVILDLIYLHGGKLPDDGRYISGVLGCSVRKWSAIRLALISRGKIQANGGFIGNYRAIIELETLGKFQDKQRQNATASNKNNDIRKPRLRHTEPDTEPYKKEEPKGSYKKIGSRLSKDWVPSQEDQAFAASEGVTGQALFREADTFRDYWTGKTGAAATKTDWAATWRNWIRKSSDQKRARPVKRTLRDAAEDLARHYGNDEWPWGSAEHGPGHSDQNLLGSRRWNS